MRVIRHYDFDRFIDAVAPIAARGEASASFFIGSAHSMKRSPPRKGDRVYLATCSGAGALGVALLRDQGPVLIGESDGVASAAFASDLAAEWPDLQGVMGAAPACDAFMQKWKELTGRESRLRVRLRQHALTSVSDVPQSAGAARVALAADADWLIDKQVAFIEEVGLPERAERLREVLPPRIERGEFRIWDDG